jgi:hypothetical protein
MEAHLNNEPNSFKWCLTMTGVLRLDLCMLFFFWLGTQFFLKNTCGKLRFPWKIGFLCGSFTRRSFWQRIIFAKRRWNGFTKCVFCGSPETIDHLFITCPFSHLVWRVVHFMYNIPPLTNVTNIFGNWLNWIHKRTLFIVLYLDGDLCCHIMWSLRCKFWYFMLCFKIMDVCTDLVQRPGRYSHLEEKQPRYVIDLLVGG